MKFNWGTIYLGALGYFGSGEELMDIMALPSLGSTVDEDLVITEAETDTRLMPLIGFWCNSNGSDTEAMPSFYYLDR